MHDHTYSSIDVAGSRRPKGKNICAARYCSNFDNIYGQHFFSFPRSDKMCKTWAGSLRRRDLSCRTAQELKNYKCCQDHFDSSQFVDPETRTKLIKHAVPYLVDLPKPAELRVRLKRLSQDEIIWQTLKRKPTSCLIPTKDANEEAENVDKLTKHISQSGITISNHIFERKKLSAFFEEFAKLLPQKFNPPACKGVCFLPLVEPQQSNNDYSYLLNHDEVQRCVDFWLTEEVPNFCYANGMVKEKQQRAILFLHSPGVLAGCPFVDAVFQRLGCRVVWEFPEGTTFSLPSQFESFTAKIATVEGNAKDILLGERIAMNCLTRACSIATVAKDIGNIKRKALWDGDVLGRGMTPGFRIIEKYAMFVGGIKADNESCMVVLTNNHILLAGSVEKAVKVTRRVSGSALKIQVECQNLSQAFAAARAGCDAIVFQDLAPEHMHSTAALFKGLYPKCLVEARGGITLADIQAYMSKNIDVISSGKLVQSNVVDLSFKIQPSARS